MNIKEYTIRALTFPAVRGLAGACIMACATGVAAHIRIHLPFTPVPITFQVFAVLLSGALLGKRYGALSQAIYIAAGAVGVPWFTGGLFGPTGGYLIGFVAAAFIAGIGMDLYIRMTLAVITIYIFGAVHLALFLGTGFMDTFRMAILPFIGFDLAKGLMVPILVKIR